MSEPRIRALLDKRVERVEEHDGHVAVTAAGKGGRVTVRLDLAAPAVVARRRDRLEKALRDLVAAADARTVLPHREPKRRAERDERQRIICAFVDALDAAKDVLADG